MTKAYPLAVSRRRAYLFKKFPIQDKLVLELGALDMPTFEEDEAQVDYMDYYSDEEFAEIEKQGALSRPLESLVKVSHAVKSKHFASEIQKRYDIIIAAHVIEHIPDPLTWLSELSQILNPSGSIFLAIPDRRYTLDYLRKETSPIEFAQRFEAQITAPTLESVADFFYNKRNIKASDVWNNPEGLGSLISKREMTLPQAFDRARRAMLSGSEHVNIHCSVFSFPTFREVWQGISETGIVDLELIEVGDVATNGNEFWVVLRKKEDADPAKRRPAKKRKFLAGRDGYLFLDNDTNDTIAQISGKSPLSEEVLGQWRRLIISRNVLCKDIGATYKFVIAPAKEVIQQQFLPEEITVSDSRPALQLAGDRKLSSIVTYPMESLLKISEESYPKDDTHWTDKGGLSVFQSIMEPLAKRIGLNLPDLDNFSAFEEERIGDLGVHTNAPNPEKVTRLTPIHKSWNVVSNNHKKNRGNITITANSSVSTGTVVVFRDSFCEVLIPYFAETFSRCVFVWNPFVDYDLLSKEDPVLVMNIMAERFIPVVPDDIHKFSWEEISVLKSAISN